MQKAAAPASLAGAAAAERGTPSSSVASEGPTSNHTVRFLDKQKVTVFRNVGSLAEADDVYTSDIVMVCGPHRCCCSMFGGRKCNLCDLFVSSLAQGRDLTLSRWTRVINSLKGKYMSEEDARKRLRAGD